MKEREKIWKDAVMCRNYKVSNDSEIVNKKTGRVLKQCDNNSGYPTVNLYDNGNQMTMSVHDIVAETFNGPKPPGLEVNHGDGNKHHNYPENLSYVTRGENSSHAYRTGLRNGRNHIPVRINETGEVFRSIKECARAINGDDRHIGQCLKGEVRTHKGFTYSYATMKDVNASDRESISLNYASDKPYKTRIRIVETGEIFDSIRECARAIGGDQGTISGCLSGKHHTHKGYHFEVV